MVKFSLPQNSKILKGEFYKDKITCNLDSNSKVVGSLGEVISDNLYNFINGNSNKLGRFINGSEFWSGSDANGNKSPYATCNGFTNTSGDGMVGNLEDDNYLSATNHGCWNGTGKKFLCFCSEN